LFFLCFVSVQICETYPQARGENKKAFKDKVIFPCCVDVKQQKLDLVHLLKTEMLNKEYRYKIVARIIENIVRPLHSQHNENCVKKYVL
jgi:hypothetical protein